MASWFVLEVVSVGFCMLSRSEEVAVLALRKGSLFGCNEMTCVMIGSRSALRPRR